MSTANPKQCLEFLKTVGRLKDLKRTGWLLKGVSQPETVSGHMYRMAVAAMMFNSSDNVDPNKVVRMCLVHDMAESVVGDITPHCGVTKQDKHEREVDAITSITAMTPQSTADEIKDLFMEYENQSSIEAVLVKDLDKFDMILQAFEYEISESKPGWLEEFFQSTRNEFKNPRVLQWVDELYRQRNELLTGDAKSVIPPD